MKIFFVLSKLNVFFFSPGAPGQIQFSAQGKINLAVAHLLGRTNSNPLKLTILSSIDTVHVVDVLSTSKMNSSGNSLGESFTVQNDTKMYSIFVKKQQAIPWNCLQFRHNDCYKRKWALFNNRKWFHHFSSALTNSHTLPTIRSKFHVHFTHGKIPLAIGMH